MNGYQNHALLRFGGTRLGLPWQRRRYFQARSLQHLFPEAALASMAFRDLVLSIGINTRVVFGVCSQC